MTHSIERHPDPPDLTTPWLVTTDSGQEWYCESDAKAFSTLITWLEHRAERDDGYATGWRDRWQERPYASDTRLLAETPEWCAWYANGYMDANKALRKAG